MRSIRIIAVFIVVVMVFCFAPLNIVSSVDINSSTEDRSEYIYFNNDNTKPLNYENLVFGNTIELDNSKVEENFEQYENEPQRSYTSNSTNGYMLPDGIYALRNKKHTNVNGYSYWMDIRGNSTSPNSYVQLYKFGGISPARNYSPSGLFRITHISGTENEYAIRLILNENLTFGINGDNIKTKTISYDQNGQVSQNDRFVIEYSSASRAYTIRPYGQNYLVSAQDVAASGAGAGDSSVLKKRTYASAGNAAEWVVEGYVTDIKDGVYSLRNIQYSNMWLDVQYNSYQSGSYLQQYAFSNPPASESDRSGLFKISRVESQTGITSYVIRLMTNNFLSPKIDQLSTYVYSNNISSSDYEVAINDQYYIFYDVNGYVLQYAGNGECISAQTNAGNSSGSSGAPYSYMIHTQLNSIDDRARWELYEFNGSFKKSGFSITNIANNNFLSLGTGTVSIGDVFYSTYIDAAPYRFSIYPYSNAPVTINSSFDGAIINATKYGSFCFYTDFYSNRSNSFIVSYISEFYVVPDNGRYYVQNIGSGLYADITGPNTNIGTYIHQWSFHASSWEKWDIIRVYGTEGYIRMKSPYSNLYLATNSSGYIIQKSFDTDYTMWYVSSEANGTVIIKNKSTGKFLAIPSNNNNRGTNLRTKVSVDDDYCRWNLKKCKYILNINNYYDSGFTLRWQQSGLSSYSMIDSYIDSTAKVLFDVFSVEIRSTIASYTSKADNIKGPYVSGNVYDYLRQNISVKVDDMYEQSKIGNETTVTILWTGHILRDGNNNINPSPRHNENKHTIIMTPQKSVSNVAPYDNLPNDDVNDRYKVSLLHEVGHSLGAHDHYCYSHDPDSNSCGNQYCDKHHFGLNYIRFCIMGNSTNYYISYVYFDSDEFFCDNSSMGGYTTDCCILYINNHLDDHHLSN